MINSDYLDSTGEWSMDVCACFRFNADYWGIFSNFHPTPVVVDGYSWKTSEAFYQAMKFPDRPDLQWNIFNAPMPKETKRIANANMSEMRPDWHGIKVDVMFQTLFYKKRSSDLYVKKLVESYGKPIVELSIYDDFWGAYPNRPDVGIAEGRNMLGLCHMRARETTYSLTGNDIPRLLMFGDYVKGFEP